MPKAAKAKFTRAQMQERNDRILDPKHFRAPGLPPVSLQPLDTLLESKFQFWEFDAWADGAREKFSCDDQFRNVTSQIDRWTDSEWEPQRKTQEDNLRWQDQKWANNE